MAISTAVERADSDKATRPRWVESLAAVIA